jgi:hypothetical protein
MKNIRLTTMMVALMLQLPARTALAASESPGQSPPANTAESVAASPTDLDRKAHEFHAFLDRLYRSLKDQHKLQSGFDGTDITADVAPFFPEGMPFDQAEDMLRRAGFSVGRHPDLAPPPEVKVNRSKDWYGVVAAISPFASGFLTRVNLYVTLMPKAPGDYSSVERVRATIFLSMP